MSDATSTRDLCRLLGGLMLDGANPALLAELLVHRSASRLGDALGGDLSATLSAIEEALGREGIPATAAEYTRLTVADGRGARRPVPVPLWEDVHLGGERRVHGERSRQVRKAYLDAGLGYDGIQQAPADHVGLEFLFVAALLEEERHGRRDSSARRDFVATHLGPCAAAVGWALQHAAKGGVWRGVGRSIVQAPFILDGEPGGRAWEPPIEPVHVHLE